MRRSASPFIHAYLTDGSGDVVVRSNDVRRDWIASDTEMNAYRCVPLNMASSLGWSFLTPFTVTVRYDGKRMGISARDPSIDATRLVNDQFGGGIFTFYLAVVFRTPPMHNLFVTGPLNEPRRGAAPLSAIVETDWAEVNLVMNWKVTEPNRSITFEKGQPFCTFFPYPRNYAESFAPELRSIDEDASLKSRYDRWLFHRLTGDGPDGRYARGEQCVEGAAKPIQHQKRVEVKPFKGPRSRRRRSGKQGSS